MAKYRLAPNDMVVRNEDEAWIPPDPGNRDRQEYEEWLAKGGVPDNPLLKPAQRASVQK